jgi:5-methylcytosine-specific restriction protein A
VTENPLAVVDRLLAQALDALDAVAESGSDAELVGLLTRCEAVARRVERAGVVAVAGLQRRGVFAERGYRSSAAAVADLLGCERFEARRRVVAAEALAPRVGLDGSSLPARLPATAAAFACGRAGLRHVEAIARVLGSAAAGRLTPEQWAGVEEQLAAKADCYTPTELHTWGVALVELLDQDGEQPSERQDDPSRPLVNELHLTRLPGGGGKVKGRFDDAAMFGAIAAVVDAKARPLTSEDQRSAGQRQAEALAEACGFVLDHGDTSDRTGHPAVPECGGHRPHLNVVVRLEDLENRARAACLDLGGTITPEALRMLACDAAVVPIVVNGKGQPLDVGRATRTIPDGLRRAVAVRDRGCAHPGCDRPPSWCEVHHIHEWERGGETRLSNLVMLCKVHHRQIHSTGWIVRIRDGLPEFVPPKWIDFFQAPRRKALPHLVGAG